MIQRIVVLTLAVLTLGCRPMAAADVTVTSRDALRAAVAQATPGTRILIAPGRYQGELFFENVRGEEGRPIVIAGADPTNPPEITGGSQSMHFADAAWLELSDIVMGGNRANGLNVDDGGTWQTPAEGIVLRNLTVRGVGPAGNCDGIKLSGLVGFVVENCTVEDWGDRGGSGIDMVGCVDGVITGCMLIDESDAANTGIQAKGGSRNVTIRGNTFLNAGSRAINIGGSTGLQFFRPEPQGYEAKDITVEGNLFIGSLAPIAFVGVDGAVVRHNTFYQPDKWIVRILQETREPGFEPSRNGEFSDNIVVFRAAAWAEGGFNIGPGTAPDTFTFARNLWYCADRPERSRPQLPTAEVDGVYGVDPRLADPAGGDYAPAAPEAAGKGHTAAPG